MELNFDRDKIVIVGDTHFGAKGFSVAAFEDQIIFFKKQLFPYMKENGIDTIIQMGDFLDHRKSMDILIFNKILTEFYDELVKNEFRMFTILGNHDIYYNSRLDVNMMQTFEKLYPDNVKVFSERTKVNINDQICYFVPWIIGNALSEKELVGVETLFGHLEIRNFEMVKGHKDENSILTSDFLRRRRKLKRVFSGHYHIKSTNGFIQYVGTPYQLNWGDYETSRGFFVWDKEGEIEFIENSVSPRFVKIKYNEENENGRVEVKGLYDHPVYYENGNEVDVELDGHKLKFFVNNACEKSKDYESDIFELRRKGCEFTVTNNVELSNLIGEDYVNDEDDNISTTELIISTIKNDAPDLLDLTNSLISEIETES